MTILHAIGPVLRAVESGNYPPEDSVKSWSLDGWSLLQQSKMLHMLYALEINNRALVFQKTSALLSISSDMHQSVFAVWGSVETIFEWGCSLP